MPLLMCGALSGRMLAMGSILIFAGCHVRGIYNAHGWLLGRSVGI